MGMMADAEGRTEPAAVYPASDGAGEWVVAAPADTRTEGDTKTFTGTRALERALEFAHDSYGHVQVLSS